MAHILLVDDDQDIRDLGRALLLKEGHVVSLAKDGREAITIMNNQSADLPEINILLSDINMPDLSGFELVRILKGEKKFDQIKIAFLTGRRERADIEEAVKLGVREYIVKPMDPLLFLQKIRDMSGQGASNALPFIKSENPIPEFATTTMRMTATVSSAIEIVALSEVGLSFQGLRNFLDGELIKLNTDLFSLIGIDTPHMKAVASQEVPNGNFETRVTFFGLSESSLSKIRAWVQKEVVRNAYSSRRG